MRVSAPARIFFADEAAAFVAVDETVAGAAVAVVEDDAALEDVGVVALAPLRLNVRSAHVSRRRSCAFAGVIDSRLGWGDFQQGAILKIFAIVYRLRLI